MPTSIVNGQALIGSLKLKVKECFGIWQYLGAYQMKTEEKADIVDDGCEENEGHAEVMKERIVQHMTFSFHTLMRRHV